MRILIVEDDFATRHRLNKILLPYGDCDVAVDGIEAVEAFGLAWEEKKPYSLICMDITMPNADGHEALKQIRTIEKDRGISGSDKAIVIMTTSHNDAKNAMESFSKGGANAYMVKPIDKEKLAEELRKLGLTG